MNKNKLRVNIVPYRNALLKHIVQNILLLVILVLIALWNGLFENETLFLTLVLLLSTMIWFIITIIRIYGIKLNEISKVDTLKLKVLFKSLWIKRVMIIDSETTIDLNLPNYANEKSKTVMYAILTMKNTQNEVKFRLTIQDAVEIYLFCQNHLNLKIDDGLLNKIKSLNQNQTFIHLKNINFPRSCEISSRSRGID
ncbi:MAG TPA: hypothetical protein VKX29_04180 [Brumimicrobium sp.]|nr:hypothetical protein [Brumimicrobium sp.]